MGAASDRAAAAGSGNRGRLDQFLGKRALGLCTDRPFDRRPFRHHPGDGRQRALRFLRPAHRFDDLHPVQPVPRDPGSRAGDAAVARGAELDLPAVIDRRQRPGAAFVHRQGGRADRAAFDQSSRAVPGGACRSISPPAPRSARRSTRSSRPRRKSACRSASLPASRARRWRFSRRSPTRFF